MQSYDLSFTLLLAEIYSHSTSLSLDLHAFILSLVGNVHHVDPVYSGLTD
jgi:hypothetical protein